MKFLVSACFLPIIYKKDFTCFLAGYQLKNEPLFTFVAFATWHLQRAAFFSFKLRMFSYIIPTFTTNYTPNILLLE